MIKKPEKKETPNVEDHFDEIQQNIVLVGREYLLVRPVMFAEDASTDWRDYSMEQFQSTFTSCGFSRKDARNILSRLRSDAKSMYVAPNKVFDKLPLHPAGYQRIDDTPCFVRTGWNIVTPQKGSPEPVIRQILRMLGTQADIFLGWLQGAMMRQRNYQAQLNGEIELPYPPLASQTLCLCGAQGNGKTHVLLSCVIRGVLGAYATIPSAWFCGKSMFGDWMLSAPVYVADDKAPMSRYSERAAFATRLKSLGYPERFSCECKGKAAIDLSFPNERICLANIENGAIKSLPDTSTDGDKFLILHVNGRAGWDVDYAGDFWDMDKKLRAAMPAFAYWLLNDYTIPAWAVGTASRRHAVMNLGGNRGYIAPGIRTAVAEIDRSGILMSRLIRVYANVNYRNHWFRIPELQVIIEESNKDVREKYSINDLQDLLLECHNRWPVLLDRRRRGNGMEYMLNTVPDIEAALSLDNNANTIECWNQNLLTLAGLTQQELEAGNTTNTNTTINTYV